MKLKDLKFVEAQVASANVTIEGHVIFVYHDLISDMWELGTIGEGATYLTTGKIKAYTAEIYLNYPWNNFKLVCHEA